SAPCSRRASPCATAASGANDSPPSENESGVTFTTPMTSVLPGLGRPGGRGAGVRRSEVFRCRIEQPVGQMPGEGRADQHPEPRPGVVPGDEDDLGTGQRGLGAAAGGEGARVKV